MTGMGILRGESGVNTLIGLKVGSEDVKVLMREYLEQEDGTAVRVERTYVYFSRGMDPKTASLKTKRWVDAVKALDAASMPHSGAATAGKASNRTVARVVSFVQSMA
jgi:hypothetical protein